MKAGRPSKYESHVKPRFQEIKQWIESGATDKEVAENLGVNQKVFCGYKNEFSELAELIKNARIKPVQEIKAALYKRACGFNYTEKKTITEHVKFPDEVEKILAEMGIELPSEEKPRLVRTEVYEKYAAPDPASAMILLKHWDKDEDGNPIWTQDPATLEIRKQELELKKKMAAAGMW